MQVQEYAEVLGLDESVVEFCERVAIVASRREYRGVACRIVTPTLYCTVPAGHEAEPATGDEYRFRAGQNSPLAPHGGWDMLASATREGDLLVLEIEQQ
jgi:hypothetical protein